MHRLPVQPGGRQVGHEGSAALVGHRRKHDGSGDAGRQRRGVHADEFGHMSETQAIIVILIVILVVLVLRR
jgi:hypothetical protein